MIISVERKRKNIMKNQASVRPIEAFELEEVPAGTGTSRSVLIGDQQAPHFAMRRFVMQPGGGMPNHTNTVEHEQYIVSGAAEVGIGDEVHQVKKGDVVFIPAGVPHWYKADAEHGFEFLCLVPNLPDEISLVDGGC
jgi:quercetin dioxygenase-like cupin family protein